MSEPDTQEYVSIIGFSYLYPISILLEALDSLDPRGPNEVQASPPENGYSVSIIVLTVLLIESAIGRTQYVMGQTAEKHPLTFVGKAFPTYGFEDRLKELFVVRDAIVHNHVWVARFTLDEEDGMKLVEANLRKNYGDGKFTSVMDKRSRTTRQLRINVFPTRICWRDAVVVLKNAIHFLLFLENLDPRYFYISPQRVMYHGNSVLFTDLIDGLSEERS